MTNPNDSISGDFLSNGGLTKREYFAAMAMQGLCANVESWPEHSHADRTVIAVRSADYLIEALNETPAK